MRALSDVEREITWQNKRQALELRLAPNNWTYQMIADHLGYSISTITKWVQEMTVLMLPTEDVETLRTHMQDSYELSERRAQTAITQLAGEASKMIEQGDAPVAIMDQIRKWEELLLQHRVQKAKLLGLNKPVMVSHLHMIRREFDEEIEALACELAGGGQLLSSPEDVLDDE